MRKLSNHLNPRSQKRPALSIHLHPPAAALSLIVLERLLRSKEEKIGGAHFATYYSRQEYIMHTSYDVQCVPSGPAAVVTVCSACHIYCVRKKGRQGGGSLFAQGTTYMVQSIFNAPYLLAFFAHWKTVLTHSVCVLIRTSVRTVVHRCQQDCTHSVIHV